VWGCTQELERKGVSSFDDANSATGRVATIFGAGASAHFRDAPGPCPSATIPDILSYEETQMKFTRLVSYATIGLLVCGLAVAAAGSAGLLAS
jgi:hypothetical protein